MKSIFGLRVPDALADVCYPHRMALLVYDMQVGIAKQIPDSEAMIVKVAQLLEAAREANVRTFFTRHMSLPLQLMGTFQLRMAMRWQRVTDPSKVKTPFLRDTPAFAIVPALAPRASEAVFDKITMSAFEGTPLQIALRDCRITALAIAGIALEVGIEPTVRHATDLGLIPILIADACGAGDPTAGRRSLETLAFEGNTIISDVATVTALMSRERESSEAS